ncbi:MAG: hypothetical protein ABI621_10180 [Chloroflexota bacterium]
MKKIIRSLTFALMISLLTATAVFALFTNGDFETGDFTGWTKSAFINQEFDDPPGAGGTDLSAIVGGPAAAPLSLSDPNTAGNLKYPAAGHYSARVNSELSNNDGGYGRNASTISQTVSAVLDPSDSQVHVRFNYAAVMAQPNDDQHEEDELPYFRIMAVNTSNGNDVLFDFYSFVGEPGRNWLDGAAFEDEGERWQYIDWTSVDLASSEAHPVEAGDIIILEITASGCSQGGHPGYIYIDEITDLPDGSPTGLSIQAAGPANANAGSTVTYTYTFSNDTGNPLDLTIVSSPPTHVTFTTLSDTVHCSGTAPVTCNFNGIATGSSGSVTITGDIALAAAGTTLVHDNYTISATGFPAVSGPPMITTVLPAGSATLTLAASGAATVKPGDQYTYTLNYTTDMAVSDAQASLTLPVHTTFASSDESCTVAGGVVTCDLGALSAGDGSFDVIVLLDKLKKAGLTLTLPATSYSISATDAATVNGSATVTADVLSPFADVPIGYWALDHIQSIWAAGVTNGCAQAPLRYCPNSFVTRADAAVLIERGMGNFAPTPNPTGMFADVPYPGQPAYYTPFIEEFYNDGITRGCSSPPLKYCPQDFATRGEAAVFIERAIGNFSPSPSTTGMFADVPYPGLEAFTPFIEELYNDGITIGCSQVPVLLYCPQSNITRNDIAVFIQRAFNLPMPS